MLLIKKAAKEVITSIGFLQHTINPFLKASMLEEYDALYLQKYGIHCQHKEEERVLLLSFNHNKGSNLRYHLKDGVVSEIKLVHLQNEQEIFQTKKTSLP